MRAPTARVTRVVRQPATPGKEDQALLAPAPALPLLACLLERVSARVKASNSSNHPSSPRASPIHRHQPCTIHHPSHPHPSILLPVPPSPHRYADTCDSACQAVHTNPTQSTPAAPRGGAASVTTAHPPRCCCLSPSISRRLRSAQGALTTA